MCGYAEPWSNEQDKIVKLRYPKGGAAAVHKELPSRTLRAIQYRACILRVFYIREREPFEVSALQFTELDRVASEWRGPVAVGPLLCLL